MLLSSSSTNFICLHSLRALMSLMLRLPLIKAKLELYVYFFPGSVPKATRRVFKCLFCELEALINKPLC